MKRLSRLAPFSLLLGCNLVVGIEDVQLDDAAGGAGGSDVASAASTTAATSSISSTSSTSSASSISSTGSTSSGGATTPLCGLTSDAFDTLDGGRWTLVGGQVAAKLGELELRVDNQAPLAALRTLTTPVIDAGPCAVWVTVVDATPGVDTGLSIGLSSGAKLSFYRNGRALKNDAGTSVDGPMGEVVLRMRFTSAPARVVYEFADGGSSVFGTLEERPLEEGATTGVTIFAERVVGPGTSAAHFDSFVL